MKVLTAILFLLLSKLLQSQELPPIQRFTASNYSGDNQNWMVSQGSNNYIYIANNKGLLEFNGAEWNTYSSPNVTSQLSIEQLRFYVTGSNLFTNTDYIGYSPEVNIRNTFSNADTGYPDALSLTFGVRVTF